MPFKRIDKLDIQAQHQRRSKNCADNTTQTRICLKIPVAINFKLLMTTILFNYRTCLVSADSYTCWHDYMLIDHDQTCTSIALHLLFMETAQYYATKPIPTYPYHFLSSPAQGFKTKLSTTCL